MTRAECARLLALCAAFDRRTVGETDVYAWQSVLEDITFDDGIAAVKAHYAERRDWIMPADIRGWQRPPEDLPDGPECAHGYRSERHCPMCRRASMRAVEA